jgi:hypothetical protein
MSRRFAVWLRNRILASLGLAIVAAASGGAAVGVIAVLGSGYGALVVAGLVAITVVVAFAQNPRLLEWAQRLVADEERRLESKHRL